MIIVFTSISRGISLISLMMLLAEAVPNAGDSLSGSLIAAPHVNATIASSKAFELPPIISSRVQPVTHPAVTGDLDAEAKSTKKNKDWFAAHGGNFSAIAKRDSNTVAGLTLAAPSNSPPVSRAVTNSVVPATPSQISTYKLYAAVASTAYCISGTWSCAVCQAYVPDGKLVMTFTTSSNINGFILRSDSKKTIFLVFRGTTSFSNWITNLDFILKRYAPVSGANVHKGFYEAYTEAATYFFADIQRQIATYPSYQVVVTGHSLGGAEALLGGMDLYQRIESLNTNNLRIYTFGCPRVGDPNFAYYVKGTGITVSRSVHNRDIVPHVPPEDMSFLHPGVEVWDVSDSDIEICTPDIETGSCSNSIVPFTSILDHGTYYDLAEGTC